MTGGQDPTGQMTVPEVVQLLLLEGVTRVVVTSDDAGRWSDADFGPLRDSRRGARPNPVDGDPDGAGGCQGRHRAAARPGVCGREPTGPQPRAAGQARVPHRHQRAGVRGLRRLWGQVELSVGAAGRHRLRTQDPHPPDQLQLGHDVSARRLSGLRHRHGRPLGQAGPLEAGGDERGPAGRGARSESGGVGRRLHRAALRHRRHRRHHGQSDLGHRRDARPAGSCVGSTRQGCRRRRGRSSAICGSTAPRFPPSNHANSSGRGLSVGVRPVGRGQRRAAGRCPRRPHRRRRFDRQDADRSDGVGSDDPVPDPGRSRGAAGRGVAGRAQRVRRCRRRRDRAVRRRPDGQHLPARRRRAAGRRGGRARARRAGDRAQRRGGRAQHRRVPVGSPLAARSRPGSNRRPASRWRWSRRPTS